MSEALENMDKGMSDGISVSSSLKLDLYNFEDPQYEGSKFVLTSPRSLEACSRLSVKPVDLLYKPLAEFQEEMLPQDIALRTIYNIYDEEEQARLRKLQLCRDERNRIIDAEQSKEHNFRGFTHKNKHSSLINTGEEMDQGSLQRRRTAWTTSVGHKRFTNDEINLRAKELHEESLKLKKELLSRKEGKAKKCIISQKPLKQGQNTPSVGTNKSVAPKSTASAIVTKHGRTSIPLHSKISQTSRPGSSRRRGNKTDAFKTNLRIPSRDMKIIKLMKEKRDEEIVLNKESRKAHLAWDEERRKEQALREQSEVRRRQLLAEENRLDDDNKQNKEIQKKQLEEGVLEGKAEAIQNKTQKWESSFSKQLMMKEIKLAEQKEKEKFRKSIQEKNLQFLEQDEEEMNKLVHQKILQDLKTAALKKQARIHDESMRKWQANKQERESFEQRKKCTEQLQRKEEDVLRCSLDMKHNKAASKFEHVLNTKLQNLSIIHQQREKKLQRARLAQKRMDDQMAAWREGLLVQRKKAEEHAVETVVRTNEMKAERAHRERVEKEKEQKANIKKVQEELMLWHKNLEKTVNAKLRKSLLLQEEKEMALLQTRAIAQESQRLRDQVRNKYNTETFDKKAFQADCYARMGAGIYSSAKNLSSIQI